MANTDSLTHLQNSLVANYSQLVSKYSPIELRNSDFERGSYMITSPGVYRLMENISFNPNSLSLIQSEIDPNASSWDSGDPLSSQFVSNGGIYDDKAFGIGFFAAIVVSTYDVVIDLNGFEISQSVEHALQQRFFSVIELADQPFISSQGPHDFGPNVDSAQNISVVNGFIGLSSHHGIHGNGCNRVLIKDVTFKGYEVCGIALNGSKNIAIVDCFLDGTRIDIPTLGIFSAGRFLRPYLNALESGEYKGVMQINGITMNIGSIKEALKTSLNNVYQDLVVNGRKTINSTTHLSEWKLFHNPSGMIDGNSYGLLLNSLGVAVLGFPENPVKLCENVILNGLVIRNHHGDIREVPALPGGGNISGNHSYGRGVIQNDPVGAVFQTLNKDSNGDYITIKPGSDLINSTYIGNVVSNAQGFLSMAIDDGFDFGHLSISRNSINYLTREWMTGQRALNSVLTIGEKLDDALWLCNGDSMFHVNKGVIGMKLDASVNVLVKNGQIIDISNIGGLGFNLCDGDYVNRVGKSHPDATYNGYGGTFLRGISLGSSRQVTLSNMFLNNLSSSWGPVYGMDVHRTSRNIEVDTFEIGNIDAGTSSDLDLYQVNPSPLPDCIGIHIGQQAENVFFKGALPRITGELSSPTSKIPYSISMNTFYHP